MTTTAENTLVTDHLSAGGDVGQPLLVDARLAGGHLTVEDSENSEWAGSPLLRLEIPGGGFDLHIHEARHLAATLLQAADRADAEEAGR